MEAGFLDEDGNPTMFPRGLQDFHEPLCNTDWATHATNCLKYEFKGAQYSALLDLVDRVFQHGVLWAQLGNSLSSVPLPKASSAEQQVGLGSEKELQLPDNTAEFHCPFDNIPEYDDGFESQPLEHDQMEGIIGGDGQASRLPLLEFIKPTANTHPPSRSPMASTSIVKKFPSKMMPPPPAPSSRIIGQNSGDVQTPCPATAVVQTT
jgi:hypothetical protein